MTTKEEKTLRGEFFPLLNAFGEAQWQSGRGVPHADIDELGEAAFAFVSRLQSRLDSLEKDAARWRYARDNFDMQSDHHLWITTNSGQRIHVQSWARHENERAVDEALQSQGATK